MPDLRTPWRRPVLLALAALAIGCSSTTSPSGISPTPTPTPTPAPTPVAPDQSNLASTPNTSIGCGSPARDWGMLFQSFTPTKAPLTRAVLRFRIGGSLPVSGVETTVAIRAGNPRGAELASTSATVSGPRAIGEVVELSFPFPHATLSPGQPYLITWYQPHAGDAVMTWIVTQGDTYPRGQAYTCIGTPLPGYDFVFATYAE